MSWTRIYANDESGTPIFGTLHALLTAVREGKEVRMQLQFAERDKRDERPKQEYFTPAENLWIRNGHLYAQNVTHVSVTLSQPDQDIVFQDDAFYWMIIANTKGQLDQTRWLVGEHTSRGRSQTRVAVTWFVG